MIAYELDRFIPTFTLYKPGLERIRYLAQDREVGEVNPHPTEGAEFRGSHEQECSLSTVFNAVIQ